jgi:hypothetical protein
MRTAFPWILAAGAAHLVIACGGEATQAVSSSTGGHASTSTTTTSSSATDGGVCDPPLAPVPPSGTSDVTYSGQPESGCFGAPCLCSSPAHDFVEHVLACDPVAGGYFLQQGSMYLRVVGRKAGACVIDVGAELEGGVSYSRCEIRLPVAPWSGIARSDPAELPSSFLEGITDRCQTVGTCCVQLGCPNPCDSTLPAAPVCPPVAGPHCP